MSINAIRIEHENGWGIFRYDQKNDYQRVIHSIDFQETYMRICDRHCRFKTRSADFPKNYENESSLDQYYCAYKTLDQLREWVLTREIQVLIKNGFTVYLYELNECLYGEDQLFFKLENVIDKRNINSLFE